MNDSKGNCDGMDVSVPLSWSVPPEANELTEGVTVKTDKNLTGLLRNKPIWLPNWSLVTGQFRFMWLVYVLVHQHCWLTRRGKSYFTEGEIVFEGTP